MLCSGWVASEPANSLGSVVNITKTSRKTLPYQGNLLARATYQYLLGEHRMGSFVMPQNKMCTML